MPRKRLNTDIGSAYTDFGPISVAPRVTRDPLEVRRRIGHDCGNVWSIECMKNRPFRERLEFALAGITEVWRRERSFRTQVIAGVAAIAVVALLRPGYVWASLVAVSIALVLALEMVNSAIEYMIDHIHPDVAPEIRRAKDAAASAVLVASTGALIVGLLMILDWLDL